MNRMGWVLLAVSLGFFSLSFLAVPSAENTHTKETIQGNSRTIERFDGEKKLHGKTEVYRDGRLIEEISFERGQYLEWKIFHEDGSIKEHWVTDENHKINRVR